MPTLALIETRTDLVALLFPCVLWVVQILLCIKVRSLWIRLAPILLCTALAAGFFVMIPIAEGLAKLGWLLLALWALLLIGCCALGWMVGMIARVLLSKRRKKEDA